jgi:hypothetical protein
MSRVRRKGTTKLRSSGCYKLESGTHFRDMLDHVRTSAPPASRPRPGRIGALAAGQGVQEHVRVSPRKKPTDSIELFFFGPTGCAEPRSCLTQAGTKSCWPVWRYGAIPEYLHAYESRAPPRRALLAPRFCLAQGRRAAHRKAKRTNSTENTTPPCLPNPASSLRMMSSPLLPVVDFHHTYRPRYCRSTRCSASRWPYTSAVAVLALYPASPRPTSVATEGDPSRLQEITMVITS